MYSFKHFRQYTCVYIGECSLCIFMTIDNGLFHTEQGNAELSNEIARNDKREINRLFQMTEMLMSY